MPHVTINGKSFHLPNFDPEREVHTARDEAKTLSDGYAPTPYDRAKLTPSQLSTVGSISHQAKVSDAIHTVEAHDPSPEFMAEFAALVERGYAGHEAWFDAAELDALLTEWTGADPDEGESGGSTESHTDTVEPSSETSEPISEPESTPSE